MAFHTVDGLPDDVEHIANYLASGTFVLAAHRVVAWFTDGVYLWAGSRIAQVRAGETLPEPAALAHMRQAGYLDAPVPDERLNRALDGLRTFQPGSSSPSPSSPCRAWPRRCEGPVMSATTLDATAAGRFPLFGSRALGNSRSSRGRGRW